MLLSASIAVVLCVCNQTQDKPTPRDEVVERFTLWRKGFLSEFHIKYDVKRKIVRESQPYDYISLGNARKENPLLMRWGGEHAWRGDFRRDITVADPKPGDFESQCLHARFSSASRNVLVTEMRAARIGVRGRSAAFGQYLPEEELFLEIIGLESRRQDVGVTLRGDKNPHKYDVLKAITSQDYAMTFVPGGGEKNERQFRFELPGVDSLTLSEVYDCAMTKRKWIWPAGSNGNAAFVEIENLDWSKVDDAVWVPFTSHIRYFAKLTGGGSPELVLEETLTVTSATTRTPDALFVPKLQTGAVVYEPGDQPAVTFRGAGQEDVLRYLSDPIGSEWEDMHKEKHTTSRVLTIAGGILLAVIVVWMYYRKVHRQTA